MKSERLRSVHARTSYFASRARASGCELVSAHHLYEATQAIAQFLVVRGLEPLTPDERRTLGLPLDVPEPAR